MSERPSTPSKDTNVSKQPLTPEQVRRIEINRLKAKALRDQYEAQKAAAGNGVPATGQKRRYDSTAVPVSASQRDARRSVDPSIAGGSGAKRDLDIQPAQKFSKYIEYDFSKMTDTKGGFLSAEDDPHNRAFHAGETQDAKPAHMTLAEWERTRLLKNLRDRKAGPFEPGLSVLKKEESDGGRICRECGSMEIDWKWEEVFACRICTPCKEKLPEKYSLLTKTEAREDYLLTDPELRDEELLPHLERPNPHKSTWNNMMLFLRYQVEEYAFSERKWGSSEALDAEFERRETDKKRKKEQKFRAKLQDLKRRTRVDAYRRNREAGAGGGRGDFGDDIGASGKHHHEWGRSIENEDGVGVKTCTTCGMEVEELEF